MYRPKFSFFVFRVSFMLAILHYMRFAPAKFKYTSIYIKNQRGGVGTDCSMRNGSNIFSTSSGQSSNGTCPQDSMGCRARLGWQSGKLIPGCTPERRGVRRSCSPQMTHIGMSLQRASSDSGVGPASFAFYIYIDIYR